MWPARTRLNHQKRGEVSWALPPLPRAAPYFFFFVAFLAAFFFAGILEIPPFGPKLDLGRPHSKMSGDEGIDILGVG